MRLLVFILCVGTGRQNPAEQLKSDFIHTSSAEKEDVSFKKRGKKSEDSADDEAFICLDPFERD